MLSPDPAASVSSVRIAAHASGVPSLAEVAYERVRAAILSGAVAAGAPLGQVELANRIGTSRVPLREALQRLEAEGLVVLRPRRGYIVTSLDRDEITDIFDIRMMLEERAGYVATLRATSEDIADVEALLRAMDGLAVTYADEAARFAEHNRAFHDRLYAGSARRQLCRLMGVLRTNVERFIRIGALIAGDMRRVNDEHHRIFEAFRARNARLVGRLCREHCEATRDRLLARLMHEAQAAARPGHGGAVEANTITVEGDRYGEQDTRGRARSSKPSRTNGKGHTQQGVSKTGRSS
jgi:DNA-binding GntR family transcriptional regulator